VVGDRGTLRSSVTHNPVPSVCRCVLIGPGYQLCCYIIVSGPYGLRSPTGVDEGADVAAGPL